MKIYLKPISICDTDLIVKWRNSIKVLSHCMTKTPITHESHKEFFKNNIKTGKYKQFIVEVLEEQYGNVAYPIATCYLKDIDNENKRCELCIFTSDDVEWNEKSQCIAIKMLLEKAFNEYGIHKVYSYVFKKNIDEIALFKNAGFFQEAELLDEAINIEGGYEDIIRFCIIK